MIRYKKNPRASKSVITVDGRQYQAKYIGKGQYSRVFRVGDRVIYYTRGDCGKEVLAQFQYHRMAHIPEIIRHDNLSDSYGEPWYVFSSPYYRNVKSSDTSAWKLMNRVIQLGKIFYREDNAYEGIQLMQRIVFRFEVESDISRSIVKALQEIVNVASNCGDHIGFDLHKKNFGVNEYGTLIFRDPIYVRE
jgi:hypothetical protein